MSVFTREAFQMSSMPERRPSQIASGSNTPTLSESVDEHIVEIDVESVLFDMDGTLINSSPAVVSAWNLFAQTYTFLDLDDILHSAHGMRTIDVLRKWCKLSDPEVLASEVIRFESAILSAAQVAADTGGVGIEVLPGVSTLLNDLSRERDVRGGEEKWAVCTSSTHFYAGKALPTAGLTTPEVFVTADSVKRGKPFPDPYLLGAEGCNASIFESLVVEDAPTGIRSGKASGARVLATCTSHSREALEKERPDFLVKDLSHVKAQYNAETGKFHLVITQPLGRTTPAPTPDATPVVTPATSRRGSFATTNPRAFFKGSDDLTGNDSVVGTPAESRAGSPEPGQSGSADRKMSGAGTGPSLENFRRALEGNGKKSRRNSNASDGKADELAMED